MSEMKMPMDDVSRYAKSGMRCLRTRRMPVALCVLLLAGVPLVGCSSTGDDGGDADSSNLAVQTPAIHVVQSSVLLQDGAPAVEKTYREALAHCSGGTLPVKPLPADVVGKLGHTYLESWYEGRRMAVKADRWDFKGDEHGGPGCAFEPVHQSQLTIVQPGSASVVDLIKGSATQQPSDGVVREAAATESAASDSAQEDEKLRAAVMAQLQQQGQGDLVAQKQGEARAAGQPCSRVSSSQGEACVWSGGAKWGFVTDGAVGADRMDAPVDSIPLWNKPADGNGYQLTTESMTVGAPIDDKVFEVPANVSVERQE